MPNIEMKASYPDLARARGIAEALGAKLLWKDEQVDTYFRTASGKLKLRESNLNGAELIPYRKTDQGGVLRSDYARIPVAEAKRVKDLLGALLGRTFEVRKTREVYLLDNVRVHLDQVSGLGSFVEFEAVFENDTGRTVADERRKVEALMKRFEIEPSAAIEGSYPDLGMAVSGT